MRSARNKESNLLSPRTGTLSIKLAAGKEEFTGS
jgi:hypothetical protein